MRLPGSGRFQIADWIADRVTKGAFSRTRDRVAELEARAARPPLVLIIADTTMPAALRDAATREWTRRRQPAAAPTPHFFEHLEER